ncbi:MAG: hypothetical protein Q9159_005652 [Coniocarpon cinnabarinum]
MVGGSRWADTEQDAAADAARKQEKEEKKRKKAEKARQQEELERRRREEQVAREQAARERVGSEAEHPTKRRKVENNTSAEDAEPPRTRLLRPIAPTWSPCRSVNNFEVLNHIEEGSYGWVSRAKESATGEIVAVKKLKVDSSLREGIPVTGLREIQCLKESHHQHIVKLREVVTGSQLDQVYLIMEFLEHDLKSLQEDMQHPFSPSEVKTLTQQLTSAVGYLHSHWILHRDLKTSNILMNNRGEIKIADFGMARYYGDPAPPMTQLVVTLWYRAPELLLGAEKYGAAIDIWSIGCVFGELLGQQPLLQGSNEVRQLSEIFELCGVPDEKSWPGFRRLPNAKSLRLPRSRTNLLSSIPGRFPDLTEAGTELLATLLSMNPAKRPGADEILAHSYFAEHPRPKHPALFPSFPSKAGQEKRRRLASPNAPTRGEAPKIEGNNADFSTLFSSHNGG